ncbi:polysaccharide biosynthesis/export family protein [Sphingobium sp. Z007]|uniref:polysaccharide biosynthesis/export family protein n=1 Tax=Sphingobium sp. Z007 TaxID=627495 RepID=UPI00278C6530|nr:polysaccharide biosynthesis/export family protein [Sphingobium sp. Z007]
MAAIGPSPIQLVQVQSVTDIPVAEVAASSKPQLADIVPPPTDMIGSGDVLEVNIYEAGVTLFSSGNSGGSGATESLVGNPGVQVQKLPLSRVDDNGDILIPYAGRLHVAGHTIMEIEAMVRASLRGMSQNPQVLIRLNEAITNSVIIGGEVTKPGRLVLQTNRETLSDVIALAGGYRGDARELKLRVVRGTQSVDLRLDDLVKNPALDVHAYPGDRISLISDPYSFSVLGASGRVEHVPFSRSAITVAEAIASAGGTNPGLGDPRAIFLFRYNRDAQGQVVPVVYHFNMMQAGTFFLAQRFGMRDQDVLYFGNAGANQPSKLIQLISQLFSPILTVTSAVQTVQNSN